MSKRLSEMPNVCQRLSCGNNYCLNFVYQKRVKKHQCTAFADKYYRKGLMHFGLACCQAALYSEQIVHFPGKMSPSQV